MFFRLKNIWYKIILSALVVIFTMTSCDIFFQKELKQDRRLAFYKHEAFTIQDSLKISKDRIKAYKTIVTEASEDKHLITPRKKNNLLSDIYTAIGAEYFASFKIDEAIENCNLAIMLNVENKDAYFNRAFIYETIGKDSLAIENYTKVIEIAEHYADAYYNRGILYEKHTDFQLAIEDYSQAIKLNPQYVADIYNNRGNTYMEMNFLDKAIEDYSQALDIDSTKAITFCNRANAYMLQGKENEAELDYKKALQIDPANTLIISKIEEAKETFGYIK